LTVPLGSIEIGLDTTQLAFRLRHLFLTSLAIVVSVILILSISVVLFFRKKLIAPLDRVNTAMDKMQNGDLTKRLAVGSRDEIAELNLHFNTMADSLGGLVKSVKNSSAQMQQTSSQVAAIATEINEMAENELHSSSEVTAASSELFDISRSVAGLAEKATQLVTRADQQAQTGQKAAHDNIGEMENAVEDVNRASKEMDELNQTAQSIHAIVGTIRGIAEQTNLLALNAAIEAARAGEQGRGFAVVADEVRTLAARTTDSIGEISGIVNQLSEKMDNAGGSLKAVVDRVHSGQQQASISAQSIQSISEDISSAAKSSSEIVNASEEQLQRLEVLQERLDSLIKIMKKNAVKASTTAMAGNELQHEAEELDSLLGQFSLDTDSPDIAAG